MLEELCRDEMHKLCVGVAKTEQIRRVWLKGEKKMKTIIPFDEFFGDRGYSFPLNDWTAIPMRKAVRSSRGSTIRLALAWFNENARDISLAWIRRRYGGDVRKAMESYRTFDDMFLDFKRDFNERKMRFMEKQTEEIQAVTDESAALAKIKTPRSHGGVANLLKVLTKTMHDQGASIYSIAKMQYAICRQAGIYLPDEFLTDVLVAHDGLVEVS